MMEFIGFAFVLGLGAALTYVGAVMSLIVCAFGGFDAFRREGLVPSIMIMCGVICLAMAWMNAPFTIAWR